MGRVRKVALSHLWVSVWVLLVVGLPKSLRAQDPSDVAGVCLSRATAILNSVHEAHAWALVAAAVAVVVMLGLVYAVCRYWVRGGWFQSLLVLVVPVAVCLGVFWAMTATTLSKVPSGTGVGLGSFPFESCRGILPDVGAADKERLQAIFSMGEAGSPYWHALGIVTPSLAAGLSVLVLVATLAVTHRKVRTDRARKH